MRLLPRSLGGRLAWGAAALITIALIVAGIGISLVLHRFIRDQVDQRLDVQITAVSSALDRGPDGAVRLFRAADTPPFDRPRSGWYWEVRQEPGKPVLRSQSLGGASLDVFDARYRWQEFWNFRPRPAEGRGPQGEFLHLRIGTAMVGDRPVTIVASAPAEAMIRPMWQALAPVLISLILLGVCLAAASVLQVRLGLRPLKALRGSVADVRSGRAGQVPPDQPLELKPLTDELNILLAQNVEGLERARRNVANLAHSLKTPLATLAISLQQSDRPADRALLAQVEQMERHIRHHLGRARSAALGGEVRVRTELAPLVADLADMFAKIHAERRIAFSSSLVAGLAAACEKQDLDEILGNVLDNAFKWAASRVSVGCRQQDGVLTIQVDDDGPGLAEDRIPEALLPGRRLDETVPGDGFGLAIASQLVELYNGSMKLERAPLGGLRVEIALPVARG